MELDREVIFVKHYKENIKLKTIYILKFYKESFVITLRIFGSIYGVVSATKIT